MKHFTGILLLLSLASCSVKPRSIETGKDICAFCKMTIMEKKFGAEIVTDKGRIFTFDDLGCMVNYLKDNPALITESKFIVASNFNHDDALIDISTAFIVKADTLETPMNGHMAVLQTQAEADALQTQLSGTLVQWKELIQL